MEAKKQKNSQSRLLKMEKGESKPCPVSYAYSSQVLLEVCDK
jgi:hypothetical protein